MHSIRVSGKSNLYFNEYRNGIQQIGDTLKPVYLFLLLSFFIIIEWFGRYDQYAIETIILRWNKSLRYVFYYLIIVTVFWFSGNDEGFIYF